MHTAPYTLKDLVRYFLWLGTFGVGGPIALIGYMQRDLVEKRRWLTHEDYIHGLALAQISPGPVATKLALYFGWLKGRVLGATLVGIALVLPSFILVTLLAIFYINNIGVSWVEGAFYGIGAAVVAIILKSAYYLSLITCKKEKLLWAIFLVSALLSSFFSTLVLWIMLGGGLIAMCVKSPPFFTTQFPESFIAPTLFTGLHGEAATSTLIKLGLVFAYAGAFVFGSGLALVPILEPIVVQEKGWLTSAQFVDAISIGLITPGPAFITSAFIGYLVAGFFGALVAVIAVFLPCYLCIILLAPAYQKIRNNQVVRGFVSGITAAAAGVMVGASFVIGKGAIRDSTSLCIFLATALLVFFVKKIPDPFVIIGAGVVGYLVTTCLP